MKNSTNTNLLILDEIFDSSLDGTGTDEFLKILNTLGDENVFVISHKQDALADKFRAQSDLKRSKTLVIYRSNTMFMKSLKLQYESEIAKAKDNIEVYLSNPAGIGEHPDLAALIVK